MITRLHVGCVHLHRHVKRHVGLCAQWVSIHVSVHGGMPAGVCLCRSFSVPVSAQVYAFACVRVYVCLCVCACARTLALWPGLPALLWSLLSSVGAEVSLKHLLGEAEAGRAGLAPLSHKEPL